MHIVLGAIFEAIFELIFQLILEFGLQGVTNKIYGNRNGSLQTITRWLLYFTIVASPAITVSYMLYGWPVSLGYTVLIAVIGAFSLIIVVIGERR